MAQHNDTGKTGEALAAAYLTAQGYAILHRNWRHQQYEIDIIAVKGNRLHFIEVKTRRSRQYGYPEDSVSKKKFNALKRAADAYLQQDDTYKWIRYDILSVIMEQDRPTAYFILEDVFM